MTDHAESPPEATVWRATHIAGESGRLDPIPDGIEVTLSLEDGRIAGKAGCNRYFASGTADDPPSMYATTMMMCPDFVMQVERAYLAALTRCERLEADEARMEGVDQDGTTLLAWSSEPTSV